MARTPDELRGTLALLTQARMSKDVQVWLKYLKELSDDLVIQAYNEKGEEAIRALGVQKGIGMALLLDKIYESQLNQQTTAQTTWKQIKDKLKI